MTTEEKLTFKYPFALVFFTGVNENPGEPLPPDYHFLGAEEQEPVCLAVAPVNTAFDAVMAANRYVLIVSSVAGPFFTPEDFADYLKDVEEGISRAKPAIEIMQEADGRGESRCLGWAS